MVYIRLDIVNKEEYETYTQLESDMAKWLRQGVVTENDYLDAKNDKERARINILVNTIDFAVFNDEVKLLFSEDGSVESENQE